MPQDAKEPTVDEDPNGVGVQQMIPQDRRRSERLKKDSTLTTKGKNERMAKKRNLEGTCSNQNMFSVLPVDDIVELTTNMGIDIDKDDFDTFDLFKHLECARYDLFTKQKELSMDTQTESVGDIECAGSPLPIEWI